MAYALIIELVWSGLFKPERAIAVDVSVCHTFMPTFQMLRHSILCMDFDLL